MQQPKYLGIICCLFLTFELVSNVTAGKLIDIVSQPVSVTVLYFPITYIFSDIITEVYGYAKARAVLWIVLGCAALASLVYSLVVALPPSAFFQNDGAYSIVLGQVPQVVLGAWLAIFAGDIANNFVLAKMKVLTKGKYLWTRVIGSTIAGQLVNTAVFYLIALTGVMPMDKMFVAVMLGWGFKTGVEIVLSPLTVWVTNKLKMIEGIDVYDTDTDFSPFRFKLPF